MLPANRGGMAKLQDIELIDDLGEDSVTILVGPNGSGKSSFLRNLAERHRSENLIVVSNTPHDRFTGTRGIPRISAGLPDHVPGNIVKRAVARSLDKEDSTFFQISSILKYCHYRPRFGFRVEPGILYGLPTDDLLQIYEFKGKSNLDQLDDQVTEELARASNFLRRQNPYQPFWIEATKSVFEFSMLRDFVAVLQYEAILRRLDVIGKIDVLLQRDEYDLDGTVIDMHQASSGQLALISSLLFLITSAGTNPIILIDEPENGLHPSWQREYVDKLLAAMAYRDARIIIATHAPLIVTGALNENPNKVSVFRVRDGQPQRLDIEAGASPSSIEEILWEAFEVVTPANHFVSEEIVRVISRFEEDKIEKDDVLKLVDELDARSFDERQKRFFQAVRGLVDKVELAKSGIEDRGIDLA